MFNALGGLFISAGGKAREHAVASVLLNWTLPYLRAHQFPKKALVARIPTGIFAPCLQMPRIKKYLDAW
jgi:hypothetical protein